jgi:regulator of sigma E protease
MLSIIGFIIVISIVVFVHEYGHYYMAKRAGVKIQEFSIGFGKPIISWVDRDGVRWKIAYIPLGGYVRMYGDRDASSSSYDQVSDKENAFYAKSAFARFLIVLAGPLANYLLALVILTLLNMAYGKITLPPIIDEVIAGAPAEAAGIKSGDRILKIDGGKIDDFADLQRIVILNPDKEVQIKVDRLGQEIDLVAKIGRKDHEKGKSSAKFKLGYLGVSPKGQPIHSSLGIFASIYNALEDCLSASMMIFKVLGQMVFGERSVSELYGPLSVAQESGKSLGEGVAEFVVFIAMLSINLGFINLLPIPLLDGGHLAMVGYEMIMGRPISSGVQNILIRFGMVIIVFLIVISASNDIRSLLF